MSVIGKLAKEAVEFAVERGAKKAATPKKPALKVVRPTAAPAILKTGSGKGRDKAADVFAVARDKKSTQPFAKWREKNESKIGTQFDYSRLNEVPNVPQTQMPRYNPPRGPSPRIIDALSDPAVSRGVNDTVERGARAGGASWYNTDPLLERMRHVVGETDAPSEYARLMDVVAATSPRSRVTDNIRTASYYNHLMATGQPIPEKPAPGYGSVAQNLHGQNVRDVASIGGWDIFKNPKPASFSTNLQGNQQNVTIDTHNLRLPGILARDPRFLATSIKAGTKGSPETVMNALAARHPGLPEEEIVQAARGVKPEGDLATYRPQDWVNKGYIDIEDAAQDPVLWNAKPNNNEYGYYENWQQEQAKQLGLSPAQYQASMWLGGGDDTGLGSTPEPFLKSVEARVKYTADMLGLEPDAVLESFLSGSMPLLAKGGSVNTSRLRAKYGC